MISRLEPNDKSCFLAGLPAAPSMLLLGLLFLAYPEHALAFDPFTSENSDSKKGNALLKEGKTAEALEKYDSAARQLPQKAAVHLNRGLALSRAGDAQIDQAMQAFQVASDGSGDDSVRARALYNLANAYFKKQDFEKAIELYKRSLMLAPGNKDAAWNLELARQKKKEKEEQQKKDQQNKDQQNQDQQNQDQQNQDQQKQDQDKKEDEQKPEDQKDRQKDKQQQQDKQENQEQQEQQQQQQQPKTKQEVEQVLDSLDEQQKNLMKQMAKQKGAMLPAGRFKDW